MHTNLKDVFIYIFKFIDCCFWCHVAAPVFGSSVTFGEFTLFKLIFKYEEVLIMLHFSVFQRKFPVDNIAEWNGGQPLGLRTVHAYVLVFDMGNLATFQVILR